MKMQFGQIAWHLSFSLKMFSPVQVPFPRFFALMKMVWSNGIAPFIQLQNVLPHSSSIPPISCIDENAIWSNGIAPFIQL
jgi:hypothetical protein